MKRIGIITMHRPLNAGCTLQAYATCEAIRQCGHQPEIIDYFYPNRLHHQDSLKQRLLHAANSLCGFLFTGAEFHRRPRRYQQFIAQFLPLSRPFPTCEELRQTPPLYDLYCTGSDQIWNPAFIQQDDSFLGAFVPQDAKLFSYASSFGVSTLTTSQREFYRRQLERFSALSTREQQGVAILKHELGLDAERVLDPTLLLTGNDWRALVANRFPAPDRPRLVIYGGDLPHAKMDDLARAIAIPRGWEILRIHGRPWQKWRPGIRHVFDVGPLEFLHYLSTAACILTSTFHGTAFALNFGVPFVSLVEAHSQDTRIANLLSLLHLESHLMECPCPRPLHEAPALPAEYQTILQQERSASRGFLARALSL